MRKPTIYFRAILVAAAATISGSAFGQQLVYSNTNNTQAANFNDNADWQVGNQINLASGPTADITDFNFQYDLTAHGAPAPTGNEAVEVTFYKNNGTLGAPGSVIFNSGFYTLSSLPGYGGFTTGSTINFTAADLGGGVVVPEDFTWIITFDNISADELAGLALYSPTTVGSAVTAWDNTGSGFQSVAALSGNPPLIFGAQFYASAPDSASTAALFSVVAGSLAFIAKKMRRSELE